MGTFDDNRRAHADRVNGFRWITFTLDPPSGDLGLRRDVARFPFVPADPARLAQDCYEAYNIQVSGLEQRLRAIGQPKIVIGVSGGLDSTHALIVAAKAMDRLGRPRTDILAFTMPGFATSDHTRNNATRLAESLGVSFATLDITGTARTMLAEMDHPFADGEPVYDVTFENVQAGLRTDYLFRLANQRGGIVLGTGDLSELALGWCTYGVGDQMSHYNVNGGVPKTLMQHLIRWVIASGQFDDEVGVVLQAILDTEITPELVPATPGEKPQSTEASIGPYNLQDFTLYHVLRHGTPPSTIAFLAATRLVGRRPRRLARGLPRRQAGRLRPADDQEVAGGVLPRFFGFAQFKRSACRTAPRWCAAGRCRRAATGGCRPTSRRSSGWTSCSATFHEAATTPGVGPPVAAADRRRPRRRIRRCDGRSLGPVTERRRGAI